VTANPVATPDRRALRTLEELRVRGVDDFISVDCDRCLHSPEAIQSLATQQLARLALELARRPRGCTR
jgi:hypothetical protein